MGALADTAIAHEFPSLDREGLVYLDSGATSQTPRTVLDAMEDYYAHHRGSVHRGVYPLAAEATELFEGARERIARWLNWGVDGDDLHPQRHRGAEPRGLRVGRRQRRAGRPRGRHRDGAPLELRALAAARAAPRGRVLGGRLRRRRPAGPRRARRPAGRRRRQGRRRRARLQHARDHQPDRGDRAPRPRRRRDRRRRRRAGRAAAAGRPRARWARTSTAGPATRPTGPPASASCTGAPSCWPRCRPSSPAGT